MKETFYFPHDTNAIQDPKIMSVLAECWLSGVAIYWILIEILHQQENWMITLDEYSRYIKFYFSFEEKRSEQVLNKIEQTLIKSNLLLNEWNFVYSKRVLDNKKIRKNISEKRSLAGKKSATARAKATSVEQNWTSVEQNPTKERKGKEIIKHSIPTNNDTTVVVSENEKKDPKKIRADFLSSLRLSVWVDKFKDENEWTEAGRMYTLAEKIGKEDFLQRMEWVLSDSFKAKNCNRISYLRKEIESFIHSPVVPKKGSWTIWKNIETL